MNTKKESILRLKYVGDDEWARPVYRDQFKRLWKDVSCGDCEHPSLYSAVSNDFDGEPYMPMGKEFIIVTPKPNNKNQFEYMMLDRMRSDCDYYLGYGNRNPDRLCSHSEREHIDAMKRLWSELPSNGKPEWLTWAQILEYEKMMIQ